MSNLTSFDVMAGVFLFSGNERVHGRFQAFYRTLYDGACKLSPSVFGLVQTKLMWESVMRRSIDELVRVRILGTQKVNGIGHGHYILDSVGAAFIEARIVPLFSEREYNDISQLGELFGQHYGVMATSWNIIASRRKKEEVAS